jgi:hypothetical protein
LSKIRIYDLICNGKLPVKIVVDILSPKLAHKLAMNQLPNPFNSNPSNPLDPLNQKRDEADRENGGLPKAYHPATKKTLQKLFIILIVGGAIIGGILSIAVLSLMQKAGLTDVPARVENSK